MAGHGPPGVACAVNRRSTGSRALLLSLAAVAGVYLLAAALTATTSGHPVRPLYEGIGPAPVYRWVDPPRQFKATNIPPIAGTQTILLTSSGSPQAGSASLDGQLILNLAAGSFPRLDGDTTVELTINPEDPARQGALPAGLFPDGNLYLVTASYEPSHEAIPGAAHPIDAVIETPAPATTVLLSTDGKTWLPLPTHHIPGKAAVATTFSQLGYLLAAANTPVDVNAGRSSGWPVWRYLLPILLAVVVLVVVGAALVWRRRNR